MSTQVVIAIVGIAGILLGAGAQYLLARRTESAKHFQELRTRSYVDFLKSTAGTVIAQRTQNSEKESEASVLMIDAKARIAIYGSPAVAAATADFFRNYGALTSPDANRSYVKIVSTMRADAPGGESPIPNIDIGQLLLSEDIQ